jgi:RNA polymerase sigma-70 factor (sigma-E family)
LVTDDFDSFYRASRLRLLGFVYVLTGNLAEAQDAVQEAFIRAWQRWSSIREYSDPESWVRVTAARIAVSRWRQVRSRARAYVRHGPSLPVPEPGTDTIEVVHALRRLPEEQRVTLALYYLMGLPVADVARELGVPIGTVKARLSRGRAALARLMDVNTGVADA